MSRRFVNFGDVPAAEWDRLVHGSPDGWVFGLSAWQRMILAVPRWALRDHSFAVYENGRMVAAMPLQWSPHSNRMSSSGWGGAGPMVGGWLTGEGRARVMRLVLDHAKELAVAANAAMLDFATSPVTRSSLAERWGVNPFAFYGYKDVSQVSQVIDLSKSGDELLADLSAKTRRILTDAEKAGIEVRQVDWAEYFEEYYSAHQETYARTGVSPHPKEYFSGIARSIAPAGNAELLAAFSRSGEVLGFNNCARFGEGAFYHTGCSRAAALDSGANHLLLWRSILAAKGKGCRWFDVGPIDPCSEHEKLRSLTVFKSRFGGEPHRCFRSEMALPVNSLHLYETSASPEAAPAVAGDTPDILASAARPPDQPGLIERAGRLVQRLRRR